MSEANNNIPAPMILEPFLRRYLHFTFGRGFTEKKKQKLPWKVRCVGMTPLLEAVWKEDIKSLLLLLHFAKAKFSRNDNYADREAKRKKIRDFFHATDDQGNNVWHLLVNHKAGEDVSHRQVCLKYLLLASKSFLITCGACDDDDNGSYKDTHPLGQIINNRNNRGETPLIRSIWNRRTWIVPTLLKEGGDPCMPDGEKYYSAIIIAASAGSCLPILKLILQKQPDLVNFSDPFCFGRTPLYQAVYSGNMAIARTLTFEHGADINQGDIWGFTPLKLAAGPDRGDKEEMLRFLLDAGADVNVRDKYGSTPLCYNFAAYRCLEQRGFTKSKLKLLLEAGASVRISCAKGWTPLDYAIQEHRQYGDGNDMMPYIPLLVQYYYKEDQKSCRPAVGHSPLHTAVKYSCRRVHVDDAVFEGKKEIIKSIVEVAGIGEFNVRDEGGKTPLELAQSLVLSPIQPWSDPVGVDVRIIGQQRTGFGLVVRVLPVASCVEMIAFVYENRVLHTT